MFWKILKGDLQKIDPVGWVKSKDYINQDYEEVLQKFLEERKRSVEWLNSLEGTKLEE